MPFLKVCTYGFFSGTQIEQKKLGVERGEHHITATLISRIFNNSSRGVVPCSNPILGPLLDCIAWVCSPSISKCVVI